MEYSVVIPVRNEEENIEGLILELAPVMGSVCKNWELILIDDASTDKSLNVIQKIAKKKDNVKIISFAENFGQSSAFAAGFETAKGEFVITMDADGQNDPKDIPKLIKELKDTDMICGWRVNRNDKLSKKITSKVANAVRKRLCKDFMHDSSCSLKIYRRSCLQKIKMFNGMHRFLPALFKLEGFKIKELPVNHRPRKNGKSNYNILNRSLNPIIDMFAVLWMRKRCLSYKIRKIL